MAFNHNDIQQLLFLKASNGFGVFDQLRGTTYATGHSTDAASGLLTMHESAHVELNTTTMYGSLLVFFTRLAEDVPAEKEYCNNIVSMLIDRAREAHEAYATWYSVTRFMKHDKDFDVLALLDAHPDYNYYFELAEQLVKDVPGIYLRTLVVIFSISFCFQSKQLAEAVLSDVKNFSPALVRNAEFPDQRLFTILEKFPSSVFWKIIAAKIDGMKSLPFYEFLQAEVAGGKNTVEITTDEAFCIAKEIGTAIYDHLSGFFEQQGSPSYTTADNNGDLYRRLLDKASETYLIAREKMHEVISLKNEQLERNIVYKLEQETILFCQESLPCIVKFPGQLTTSEIEALQESLVENAPLVLTVRYCAHLKEQYSVVDEATGEWFEQNKTGIVTFCRFALQINGEKVIILVPFINDLEIKTFIAQFSNRMMDGCIYFTATIHDAWEQQWTTVFNSVCSRAVYVNDISPLLLLEKYYPDFSSTAWCKTAVRNGDKLYSCLVYLSIDDAGDELIMLAPSSNVYAEVMAFYSYKWHPQYQAYLSLTEDLQSLIKNIYENIYMLEHSYHFRTGLVAEN